MKFKQYQYLKQHLFEFTAPDELKNRYEDIPTRNLSPLVLAYVGDAYYHLYIRTRLLNFEQSRVHLLNDFSMKLIPVYIRIRYSSNGRNNTLPSYGKEKHP